MPLRPTYGDDLIKHALHSTMLSTLSHFLNSDEGGLGARQFTETLFSGNARNVERIFEEFLSYKLVEHASTRHLNIDRLHYSRS